MICLNCKHCFHCSTYLIDQDNLDKPVDIKDIQDICKVMGGYSPKEVK